MAYGKNAPKSEYAGLNDYFAKQKQAVQAAPVKQISTVGSNFIGMNPNPGGMNPNGPDPMIGKAPKVVEDPYTLQAIQKRQLDYADKLSRDLPSNVNALTGAAEGQIRGQVGQLGKQSDQGYNARGMLYSGARQAAKTGIEAQGLGDIAAQRSKIAGMLQDQVLQARDQGINTGLGIYDLDKQARDQEYNMGVSKANQQVQDILERYRKEGGAIGSLLGGVGSIAGAGAGAYAANKK